MSSRSRLTALCPNFTGPDHASRPLLGPTGKPLSTTAIPTPRLPKPGTARSSVVPREPGIGRAYEASQTTTDRQPRCRRFAATCVASTAMSSQGLHLYSGIVQRLRKAGCVFAEEEARLLISHAQTSADLEALVEKRTGGLPLESVLGWADFCGLRISIDTGVFVPRRRTELLIRQAVSLVREARTAGVSNATATQASVPPRTVVVDLCCGSGALGVALVAALDHVELHAVDIDSSAVRCARRNVSPFGGHAYQGDLYDALPTILKGRIDVIVANVPYVPTGELALLPPEARIHEPKVALDGGVDGLHVLRRVTQEAPLWLAPGGHLLVETSERQGPQAVKEFTRKGLVTRMARSDELNATVVIGTWVEPSAQRG